LLSYLLSLERAGLYFFYILILYFTGNHSDSLLFLCYLVVMAMESVLGLVLFVMFVRQWGKDYVGLLSITKF